MPESLQLAFVFSTGIAAGAVNVLAGGGSALTLPILMWLGLDAGTANGTNRVAIVVQSISANASFGVVGAARYRQSTRYALWTVPGALAGAFTAVQITDEWFERILGIVLVCVVVSMVIPRAPQSDHPGELHSRWICPALLLIGFYGGFIQLGVGFLIMAAFYHMLQMDLVRTTVHKVAIILVYTVPALMIFAVSGHIDWILGFVLAAGNASGAWLAARASVRKGEKVVRRMLIVAILLMAAKTLKLI